MDKIKKGLAGTLHPIIIQDMNFSKTIQLARKKRRMTQARVAKMLGCSPSAISLKLAEERPWTSRELELLLPYLGLKITAKEKKA